MLYFANPCGSAAILEQMRIGVLGYIDTPRQGQFRPDDVFWCADNGCFGKGYPGDENWIGWLGKHADRNQLCAFATAPDVVGDAEATLARSAPWLPEVRRLGYPAALVAQDGLEHLKVPWDTFDALFIGGSTEWKLGPGAEQLVRESVARGKWTHVGRVNSGKRFRLFRDMGADSADGTFFTFGPDTNLPRFLRWNT